MAFRYQSTQTAAKRRFAEQLSRTWPFPATAILPLLDWLEFRGEDWQRPYFFLKMAVDVGLDLGEVEHLISATLNPK